jgi:hypothetical protein
MPGEQECASLTRRPGQARPMPRSKSRCLLKDLRIGSGSVRSLRANRLAPKLRRETVDLHLGVLVFGVRSDCTFNDLAHRRH